LNLLFASAKYQDVDTSRGESTMPMRIRPPAPGTIKVTPRIMQSRFENTCGPCGKAIEKGELIYYDRWSASRAICMACGSKKLKLASQGLSEASSPAEYQSLIDRVRQLKALPGPLKSEWQEDIKGCIIALKTKFCDHSNVRKYLHSLSQCDENERNFVCIRSKFTGFCVHCGGRQVVGTVVFYDRKTHRIHCLVCDIPLMHAMPP
jgi:hypothetical protein